MKAVEKFDYAKLQILDVCDMVDTPSDHTVDRRSISNYPHTGAHGRAPQPSAERTSSSFRSSGVNQRCRSLLNACTCQRIGSPNCCAGRKSPSRLIRQWVTEMTPNLVTSLPTMWLVPLLKLRRLTSSQRSLNFLTASVNVNGDVQMRFGLGLDRPRTLEEVGAELGVTRERIRQIEAKTLARLRSPLMAERLREFLQ